MFASDNIAGVCPEILDAIIACNKKNQLSYGEDIYTEAMEAKFCELFERQVFVYTVPTGTAANSLALAHVTPPYGAIYCDRGAHIAVDEAGAPEFFTGGAKLITIKSPHGKLRLEKVRLDVKRSRDAGVHSAQPAAISISQSTECGTVYTLDELQLSTAYAHNEGMKVHMDGARFANALVDLDCSPAEMSWQVGVDVLCFGATKNGAMGAEAIVFFDEEIARNFAYRRKKGGHLISKMRYVSVQFLAYLENNLWLKNARHANKMADFLATGLKQYDHVSVKHPVQANEIFAFLEESTAAKALAAGFHFYNWQPHCPDQTQNLYRFVTNFATKKSDIEELLEVIRKP